MNESKKQNCPLCGQSAIFCLEDYGNIKHYYCNQCADFLISIAAEKLVLDFSENKKQSLAKMSKAKPEGQYLSIRKPNSTETQHASIELAYIKRPSYTPGPNTTVSSRAPDGSSIDSV